MQRIVSEVQRKYGIETKGQAIQYSIDALNADIKFEEEQLSKVKESQKAYSSVIGDFGLSWKKRTDAMLGGKYVYSAPKKAVGFGIASLDTLRRTGVRAYNAYKYNKREDEIGRAHV